KEVLNKIACSSVYTIHLRYWVSFAFIVPVPKYETKVFLTINCLFILHLKNNFSKFDHGWKK
ncbi:hypothetical protein, partial [Sphingobacterium sp. UBA7253]